jgi:hypothetical protein
VVLIFSSLGDKAWDVLEQWILRDSDASVIGISVFRNRFTPHGPMTKLYSHPG